MGEWFKEKWIELLILAIIVPSAIGGITWAFDIGAKLAVQENRTETILASLPELRTRVAHESIYGAFQTAVLVSQPYERNDQWFTELQLLDAANGKVTKFETKMTGPNDTDHVWAVYGKSLAKDPKAANFDAMQNMATTVDLTKMLPPTINSESSFVSYVPADQIETVIKTTGATEQNSIPAPDVNTWPTLLDATAGILKPQK
ncbi:hypothetical protein [Mesorhizobium sp. ORM16]|uniref:hypothetical protein n=1 Tax=Mesorhizobium sp. ORM16 TaxID=3376989 RepID=UPI003857A6C7